MEWREFYQDISSKINWKFSIYDRKKLIFRPENGYFVQVTPEECRIEVRTHLQEARPGTINDLVTSILQEKDRMIDPALFREGRERSIGFLNGIFDLNTGQLRKYDSHDFILDPLPHHCPRYLDDDIEDYFLGILEGWVGKETANWFLNLLAYLLFIFPNGEQKWINLFGMGANGKSVCLKILEKILGDDKCIGCNLDHVTRFTLETFQGRWLVVGRDSGSHVGDAATAIIKNYSGDDKGLVELKGGGSFDAPNTGKLIVSTNSLIQSRDRSHGWFRRILPIPFPNSFEEDPSFEKKVLKKTPQIMRLLLHRAYLYKKNNIRLKNSLPAPVRELINETRYVNDRCAGFWDLWFHETVEKVINQPDGSSICVTEQKIEPEKLWEVHKRPMSEVYDLFKYWHEQEFGSDMEVKPSMKGFGGPYGDFLTSGAGQYFEYKRTGHGRLVVMREQWQAKLEDKKPVEQEQEQEEIVF